MTDEGLAELLTATALGVAECGATSANGTTTWAIGGAPFASLTGSRVEFRLGAVIGTAARHTPDTSASPRGPDWVAFHPGALDQYAGDRARAWFVAAARRAAPG